VIDYRERPLRSYEFSEEVEKIVLTLIQSFTVRRGCERTTPAIMPKQFHMLTDKQEFKYGFIEKCAELGLAPEQTLAAAKSRLSQLRRAKQAALATTALAVGGATAAGGTAAHAAQAAVKYPAMGAVYLPGYLGRGAGTLLAKLQEVGDPTVEEMQAAETLELLRQETQRAKRRAAEQKAKSALQLNRRYRAAI